MARESTMKQFHAAPTQPWDDPWSSLTVLSGRRMLSNLGGGLRNAYEDVMDSDQPSDLVRLAALIDEQRGRSET